jgi:uncharacterized protein involved in exopolysaccharide biosynthesis
VNYDASDPELAAQVLKSLADVYLEKHKDVHRPKGQLHFFDQQTGESRRQLEAAEATLLNFTDSHRVVMAGQQRDLALLRLSEVEANYRQAEVEMSETQDRVHELDAQVAQLPERTTTQVRTADKD